MLTGRSAWFAVCPRIGSRARLWNRLSGLEKNRAGHPSGEAASSPCSSVLHWEAVDQAASDSSLALVAVLGKQSVDHLSELPE